MVFVWGWILTKKTTNHLAYAWTTQKLLCSEVRDLYISIKHRQIFSFIDFSRFTVWLSLNIFKVLNLCSGSQFLIMCRDLLNKKGEDPKTKEWKFEKKQDIYIVKVSLQELLNNYEEKNSNFIWSNLVEITLTKWAKLALQLLPQSGMMFLLIMIHWGGHRVISGFFSKCLAWI